MVSDLRNKFTEIESAVKTGSPVYLTKNEDALDIADKMAEETDKRYTHDEVFAKLRGMVKE